MAIYALCPVLSSCSAARGTSTAPGIMARCPPTPRGVTTWRFSDCVVPLWVATLAGMAFGFALGRQPMCQGHPCEKSPRRVRSPLACSSASTPHHGPGCAAPETVPIFSRAIRGLRPLLGTWALGRSRVVVTLASLRSVLLFGKTKVDWRAGGEEATLIRSSLSCPDEVDPRGSWALPSARPLAGVLFCLSATMTADDVHDLVYSRGCDPRGLDIPIGSIVSGLGRVARTSLPSRPRGVVQDYDAVRRRVLPVRRSARQPSGLFGTAKVKPYDAPRQIHGGARLVPVRIHQNRRARVLRAWWGATALVIPHPTRRKSGRLATLRWPSRWRRRRWPSTRDGYCGIVSLGFSCILRPRRYTMPCSSITRVARWTLLHRRDPRLPSSAADLFAVGAAQGRLLALTSIAWRSVPAAGRAEADWLTGGPG